ncbi:MAG: hypothetical protein AMXMBFR84_19430 [Candidatus Hydrogenedentota bacterium]
MPLPADSGEGADTETPEAEAPVEFTPETAIQALDLRQRIAQLMIISLQGVQAPDSDDRAVLKNYSPGGVILGAVLQPGTVAEYVTNLRSLPGEQVNRIPMFIGTDLYSLPRKNDMITRRFFVPLPSLMAIAAAGDSDVTLRFGAFLANHLNILGFNMHWGPSLELSSTIPEAEGNVQSLGSDPVFVAQSGMAIFNALKEKGVVCVVPGFPGGGQNRRGNEPGVLVTPRDALLERDLHPYVQAIANGATMIHVGNTLVPTIDRDNKLASVSPAVIRDLLRGELKYEGIVVAGPMDGSDITMKYDPSVAAVESLNAGADMLFWNRSGVRVMKTIEDIVKAVEEGRISQDTIDAALLRVLEVKKSQNLLERPRPIVKEAEKLTKKKEYPREVYEMERRAVTVVQNRNNLLPLTHAGNLPVGVTGIVGVEELQVALEEYFKAVPQQEISTAKYSDEIYDFEIERLTKHIGGIKTVVLTLSNDIRIQSQLRLIRAMKEKGLHVVIVLLGYPSNLPKLSEADAIILTYGLPGSHSESMKAVADVLVGQGPLGIMPVVTEVKTTVGKVELYSVLDVIRSPVGRLPVSLEPPYEAGLGVAYDPTYTIDKVEWQFGDGQKSKEFRVEKAFSSPGRYPITLTIIDKKKISTTRTLHAIVE